MQTKIHNINSLYENDKDQLRLSVYSNDLVQMCLVVYPECVNF